ncbi:MAG TPA: biotin--[acetyl-CoA-carboxylase] ligase [Flavobacterium sp.]|nr:biotin--[acetyl-CoA-carboxylase] ligase [Flavobacterium sp.]
MKLVKLDAIDSTNDFLKRLSNEQPTENFTVVTAENQTKGKGQMGAVWDSEIGKNLIMSVLIKEFLTNANQIFNLNIVVSLSVIKALETLQIPGLSIKWPNDIMSDNKKVGGILIENSIKSDGSIFSIAGLGLNVNQINFENLPKASSLAVVCNHTFNKEQILFSIVENIEMHVQNWDAAAQDLWASYAGRLFKKGIPTTYMNPDGKYFMGIIDGVSTLGKLRILLEDNTVADFDIKEIQMIY